MILYSLPSFIVQTMSITIQLTKKGLKLKVYLGKHLFTRSPRNFIEIFF